MCHQTVSLIARHLETVSDDVLQVGESSLYPALQRSGGTSEVAVMSMGGDVVARSLRVAGDELDEDIVAYIRNKYNLLIGDRMAEQVKVKIGSAYPLEEETTLDVKGRDILAGLPKTVTITSEEIREALSEPLMSILEAVRIALERTPPELSADIYDNGIHLTGGGALLRGLDKRLAMKTKLQMGLA